MSHWGSLDAEFHGKAVSRWMIEEGLPTGSESGPTIYEPTPDAGRWWVEGRLRDVQDFRDSPAVLAWFVRVCDWADRAELKWRLDVGLSYWFTYTADDGLRRQRGVLDG